MLLQNNLQTTAFTGVMKYGYGEKAQTTLKHDLGVISAVSSGMDKDVFICTETKGDKTTGFFITPDHYVHIADSSSESPSIDVWDKQEEYSTLINKDSLGKEDSAVNAKTVKDSIVQLLQKVNLYKSQDRFLNK